jgi:hypothetical protein
MTDNPYYAVQAYARIYSSFLLTIYNYLSLIIHRSQRKDGEIRLTGGQPGPAQKQTAELEQHADLDKRGAQNIHNFRIHETQRIAFAWNLLLW